MHQWGWTTEAIALGAKDQGLSPYSHGLFSRSNPATLILSLAVLDTLSKGFLLPHSSLAACFHRGPIELVEHVQDSLHEAWVRDLPTVDLKVLSSSDQSLWLRLLTKLCAEAGARGGGAAGPGPAPPPPQTGATGRLALKRFESVTGRPRLPLAFARAHNVQPPLAPRARLPSDGCARLRQAPLVNVWPQLLALQAFPPNLPGDDRGGCVREGCRYWSAFFACFWLAFFFPSRFSSRFMTDRLCAAPVEAPV